ncbi:MAG: hypothetical protein JW738_06890 [Actinobacteria bacterium]|nr:hypothetical protein [Actinomycetota bacterium]
MAPINEFFNENEQTIDRISILLALLLIVVSIEPLYRIVLSFIYFDTNAESIMLKSSFPSDILGLVSSISGNVISVLPWILLILLMGALVNRQRRRRLLASLKWLSLIGVAAAAAAAIFTAGPEIYQAFITTGDGSLCVNWIGVFLYTLIILTGGALVITFYVVARNIERAFPQGDFQNEQQSS